MPSTSPAGRSTWRRAGVGAGAPTLLPERESASGRYETAVSKDPFAVSGGEREELLERMVRAAAASAGVVGVQSGINAKRQHRHFADSDGSRQHQHLVECGAMVVATALGHGDVQRRSYPNSFHGNTGGAGWEFVVGLDLESNADRVGREAVELLTAPMATVRGRGLGHRSPAAVAADPRVGRARARTRPDPRRRERTSPGPRSSRRPMSGSLRYGSPAVTITSDPDRRGHPGQLRVRRRRDAGGAHCPGGPGGHRRNPVHPGVGRPGWSCGHRCRPQRRLGVPAGLFLHPRIPASPATAAA